MTELATYQPAAEQGVDMHRPDLQQWAQNLQAAHQIGSALCSTSFAPAHFRGKPDEAAAAILYGSEVGFTPTQALQNLYVIGGKPALYARPMVAIVQAHGHKVWTEEKTDESVTVCGQRKGSQTIERETWTIARAEKAGYTSNKKYQTDPQAMLYARAASDVCRRVAADALAGMVYSVEELQLEAEPAAPTVKTPGLAGLRAAVQPTEPAPVADVTDAEVLEDDPDTAPEPKLSARNRGRLFALFTQKGIPEDQQLAGIAHVIGRTPAHRDAINEDEFARVVAQLETLPDAAAQAGQ